MESKIFGLAAGDAATWALVVIGFVTLVSAVGAWRSSSKLLRVEQRRDAQAEQISAWAEQQTNPAYDGSYFVGTVNAVVRNPTKLPIYGVYICWERAVVTDPTQSEGVTWEVFKTEDRDLVPPESSTKFSLDNQNFDLVSKDVSTRPSMASRETTEKHALAVANRIRISVSFLDSMGQRWERGSNGKLLPVKVTSRSINPRYLFM